MLSNFHKTTSECWQRTPGTQKGSPFSSKRRDVIDCLIALYPFDSPFSYPGHLYLLPLPSLLYLTLWIALGVPGCGEHLGIRLLARLLPPLFTPPFLLLGLPCGSAGKESACNVADLGSNPGLWRSPWGRECLPTPIFLPGESHRQRSLVGYSP